MNTITLHQIDSPRIRKIITSSATPACDICEIDYLDMDEFHQANAYFNASGGLYATRSQETAAMRALDC